MDDLKFNWNISKCKEVGEMEMLGFMLALSLMHTVRNVAILNYSSPTWSVNKTTINTHPPILSCKCLIPGYSHLLVFTAMKDQHTVPKSSKKNNDSLKFSEIKLGWAPISQTGKLTISQQGIKSKPRSPRVSSLELWLFLRSPRWLLFFFF